MGGSGAGVTFSLGWIEAPRRVIACGYLALGWMALLALPELLDYLGPQPLALLAGGGLLYSAGAVVYACQRPDPWPRWFGFHEIFDALVIVAAAPNTSRSSYGCCLRRLRDVCRVRTTPAGVHAPDLVLALEQVGDLKTTLVTESRTSPAPGIIAEPSLVHDRPASPTGRESRRGTGTETHAVAQARYDADRWTDDGGRVVATSARDRHPHHRAELMRVTRVPPRADFIGAALPRHGRS